MTIPIAPIAGVIAAPSMRWAVNDILSGNIPSAIRHFGGLVGLKFETETFDWATLQNNAIPIVAGLLVHKGASMLGLNRVLGKAKIPWIRV
jgi:hypothetical protein